MSTLQVHCPCGETTLHVEGDSLLQFYCHCADCQAASGGAYIAVALFPANAVTVHGDTFAWTYKTMPRHRCKSCGTVVKADVTGLDQCGINARWLPPDMFKPGFHIHCHNALMPVRDNLPHYVELPAMFGGADTEVDW